MEGARREGYKFPAARLRLALLRPCEVGVVVCGESDELCNDARAGKPERDEYRGLGMLGDLIRSGAGVADGVDEDEATCCAGVLEVIEDWRGTPV